MGAICTFTARRGWRMVAVDGLGALGALPLCREQSWNHGSRSNPRMRPSRSKISRSMLTRPQALPVVLMATVSSAVVVGYRDPHVPSTVSGCFGG